MEIEVKHTYIYLCALSILCFIFLFAVTIPAGYYHHHIRAKMCALCSHHISQTQCVPVQIPSEYGKSLRSADVIFFFSLIGWTFNQSSICVFVDRPVTFVFDIIARGERGVCSKRKKMQSSYQFGNVTDDHCYCYCGSSLSLVFFVNNIPMLSTIDKTKKVCACSLYYCTCLEHLRIKKNANMHMCMMSIWLLNWLTVSVYIKWHDSKSCHGKHSINPLLPGAIFLRIFLMKIRTLGPLITNLKIFSKYFPKNVETEKSRRVLSFRKFILLQKKMTHMCAVWIDAYEKIKINWKLVMPYGIIGENGLIDWFVG